MKENKLIKFYSEEINELTLDTETIRNAKYTKEDGEYIVVVSGYDEDNDIYEQEAVDATGLQDLAIIINEVGLANLVGIYSKGKALNLEYSFNMENLTII